MACYRAFSSLLTGSNGLGTALAKVWGLSRPLLANGGSRSVPSYQFTVQKTWFFNGLIALLINKVILNHRGRGPKARSGFHATKPLES